MPNFYTLGSIHRILTASLFASLPVSRRSLIWPQVAHTRYLKLDAELDISDVDTYTKAVDDDPYTGVYLNLTAETLLVNSALKLHFRQVNIVNFSPMQKSIYRHHRWTAFPPAIWF